MKTIEGIAIKRIRQAHDGQLPAFSWPGAYPIAYIDAEGSVLCYRCANTNNPELDPVLRDYMIVEEGNVRCDACSVVIFEEEDTVDGSKT